MAGIPHLAGGGVSDKLTPGARAIYNNLVRKATAVKRAPLNAKELAFIENHANSLSKPTSPGIPTQPGRLEATTPHPELLVDRNGYGYRAEQGPFGLTTPEQARGYQVDPFGMSPQNMSAREDAYQIGTRALKTKVGGEKFATLPTKLKVIDDRDPFLTEAMTGRRPSGTYQKPFTTNIDDFRANQAAEEARGKFGASTDTELGGLPVQSTTPSADYFANMAAGAEQPYVWRLKKDLEEILGRKPTDDEVNMALADLNPLGQDYTGKGATVFALKPEMPKGRPTKAQQTGIDAWRQKVIDSGQSRSSADASNYDLKTKYPSLQREIEWGPEPEFKAGGSTTPAQMRHMMDIYGYKDGSKVSKDIGKSVAMKVLGPGSIMAFNAPSIMEMGKAVKAGKPSQGLGGAYDLATAFMPLKNYVPLTLATYSSELGDASLDAYEAQRQAELEERLSKSPVLLANKMAPIDQRDEFGRSPLDRALNQFYQEEGETLMKHLK